MTDPVLTEKIVCPAGLIVSSFQAELHVILSALRWLRDHMDNWENACIANDSQSVLVCLRNSRCGLLD